MTDYQVHIQYQLGHRVKSEILTITEYEPEYAATKALREITQKYPHAQSVQIVEVSADSDVWKKGIKVRITEKVESDRYWSRTAEKHGPKTLIELFAGKVGVVTLFCPRPDAAGGDYCHLNVFDALGKEQVSLAFETKSLEILDA